MVKVHTKGSIFDHPRRHRKLAWYAEILCSRLLKLEQIAKRASQRPDQAEYHADLVLLSAICPSKCCLTCLSRVLSATTCSSSRQDRAL